jgi:hypothetical protein
MKNALFFIFAVLFLQVAGITFTHAQACRPETRVVEKDPVGPRRNCMGVPGLYFKRSLCNVPAFRTYDPLKNEIMVPPGRTAGCFVIVASVGTPVWKIYDPATGALLYNSGGPIAGLRLPGGGAGKLFKMEMDPTTSTPGASVTIAYIEY